MKKIICLIAVIIITASFIFINKKGKVEAIDYETRGVFISYLEYQKYLKGKGKEEIDNVIKEIIDSLDKYFINTIYLQVRMESDAIYKSNIFPSSESIVSKQGDKLEIDVLSTFIKYAKLKNIKIYAWINPYRISSSTDINKLSVNNPAYKYLNTNHVKIIENKGIYYNPASKIVKNLIVSGVLEIVENYDIAGILFDDYFYPSTDIDLENYEEYKDIMTIKDYRLMQVNDLIRLVYKTIKSINSNIEFGISPDGNIENNYELSYADVKTWLSEEGYIDFIMPQLYYGFYNDIKPFIKTANEWNNLIKNNVRLILALSLYKSGNIDEYAKSGSNEWIDYNDIISREIEYGRVLSHYDGYSLFRYEYLVDYKNPCLDKEIENYLKAITKKIN